MKIKKPMTVKAPGPEGGATIADRFRLDTVQKDAAPKGAAVGRTAAACAFSAGLLGLLLAAGLAGLLYKHWEYLMPV